LKYSEKGGLSIRVFKRMGVNAVILTNAAGGINAIVAWQGWW